MDLTTIVTGFGSLVKAGETFIDPTTNIGFLVILGVVAPMVTSVIGRVVGLARKR